MNKRGQGLPINVIIIAAISLLVLIILIALVQTRTTFFSKGVKEVSEAKCEKPYQVKPIGDCQEVIYGAFANVGTSEVCCKQ